ncbi:hypothetical protein NMY3_02788 [Candidatus Nitrosocosmicus oleophilus]|jgi:hypothetical protein|uniref:Uncharacterized protein n=1 Tax=Candidatus Nitrosocosmicus oleophilus TaxID=1353260 RepID=A0A654LZU0_9ARCH|nr:hypothetical protein [Candidatus Nitrosocosmicus oleophilus]ALI36978.1 hypothetical protein NMY3_02788 [Candidatus Nitrosocosmicus oleophilus]
MNREEIALNIISKAIKHVQSNPQVVRENGCAACHVLFVLAEEMNVSEQDASDLLSEVLSKSSNLDDEFIAMVENIHMKKRMMGNVFAIKTRESKDKYIDSNFKNTIAEIHSDLINYGPDVTLRKLLISLISLEIAKNIGTDYHASTEELYHYMRRNHQDTNKELMVFINQLYQIIIRVKINYD